MEIDSLIKIVNDKATHIKTKFYDKTIKVLIQFKTDYKYIPKIYNHEQHSAYILEAIKLFLINNFSTLKCILIKDKTVLSDNDILFIRTISLSRKALNNLFKQILVLNNSSL